MKLIDVNGVKDSLLTDLLTGVDGGTDGLYLKAYEVINRIENIVNEWVDNQPTVEAIPIEWVKKFRNQFEPGDEHYKLVDWLLNIWEKENE